jgi:circadian clock protein KaiB
LFNADLAFACGLLLIYTKSYLHPATISSLAFALTKTSQPWEFDLYVAGSQTLKSLYAYRVLKQLCCQFLDDDCTIHVIDISKNPKIAIEQQILATPTTIRRTPLPQRILLGDLSDETLVIIKLELKQK